MPSPSVSAICGLVPLLYSSILVKPSLSISLTASEASSGSNPLADSKSSGIPSLSSSGSQASPNASLSLLFSVPVSSSLLPSSTTPLPVLPPLFSFSSSSCSEVSVSVSFCVLSSGLDNTYAVGSLVQVLTEKEPSGQPPPAYTKVDDYIKFAIASIANQINFAS